MEGYKFVFCNAYKCCLALIKLEILPGATSGAGQVLLTEHGFVAQAKLTDPSVNFCTVKTLYIF